MAHLSSTYEFQIPGSERNISFKVEKRGLVYRLLRVLLVSVVVVTFIGNIIFILAAIAEMRERSSDGNVSSSRTRGEGSQPIISVQDEADPVINVEVYSSQKNISMNVNGKTVNDVIPYSFTGIHAVVLNQATGARMASMLFDTYTTVKDSDLLVQFLNDVTVGRIICLATRDEASHSLKKNARNLIKSYGSTYVNRLQWRDMWAFVVQKRKHGGRVLAEGFQKCPNPYQWASPVTISTSVLAGKAEDSCKWEDNEGNRRRREFCSKYDAYPQICNCENPISVDFDNPPFPDGSKIQLPVAIMASNRPRYLFRMLLTLKDVIGLNVTMVTIYIDGYFDEPALLGKLFNIKVYQHEPKGLKNSRISQHYKKSLTTSFDSNPEAQYLVILEEDLDIAVDILSFFRQLLPVLGKDESLFCISAWNDQGYKHTSNDASMTYRIESMPGLGWVLPRKIYKNELEPNWPSPDKMWDWDMWIRGLMLKQRECVIPDISRTFHFGAKGLNINPYFQELYFNSHAINVEPSVKINPDLMYKDNYEKEVRRLVSSAIVLDHSKTPCTHPLSFVPDTRDKIYVYYIKMNKFNDNQNWINAAHCFKIWDLDMRGYHKGLFRLWIKGNQLLVIGCPDSPYCEFKPSHVTPVDIHRIQDKKSKPGT